MDTGGSPRQSPRASAEAALVEAVARFGPEIADDLRRLEAVLRDLAGEHKGEVSALAVAAGDGVAPSLLTASGGMRAGVAARLALSLERDRSLTPGVAGWAVAAWSHALGLSGPSGLTEPEVGRSADEAVRTPDPPTAPVPLPPTAPVPTPDPEPAVPAPVERRWRWPAAAAGLVIVGASVAGAAVAFSGGDGPTATSTTVPPTTTTTTTTVVAPSGSNSAVEPGVVPIELIRSYQVGRQPLKPLVTPEYVWVPNFDDATVTVIGISILGEVEATIPVGAGPLTPTAAAGSIWVPNSRAGTISVIDPERKEVTGTVAVDGDLQYPLLAAGDLLWASHPESDSLSVIDPVERAVLGVIEVGDGPGRPLAAFGQIWVANELDATVAVIDPATRTVVEHIPVGPEATAPIVANGLIWVASAGGENAVYVIDPTALEVINTLRLGESFDRTPVNLFAYEQQVWVMLQGGFSSLIVDAGTFAVSNPQSVQMGIDDPLIVRDLIWYPQAVGGSDNMIALNPATLVESSFDMEAKPGPAASGGHLVYVPLPGVGLVAIVSDLSP